MRRVVLAFLLGGCGFEHGALGHAQLDDGPTQSTDDALIDTPVSIDARIDSPANTTGVCNGKLWIADFTNDPTAEDLNGDGTNDWAIRNGGVLDTTQLFGGVWHLSSAGAPLDTQPKQAFTTRTVVDVRMRNTTTSGAKGAVFWINVDFDATGFAPLFVDVKLQMDSTQTAYVMTKNVSAQEVVSATISNLPTGFIHVHLDIDPAALKFSYTISDGSSSSSGSNKSLTRLTSTVKDQWATVIAFSGASEFDRVQVEVCP